jgi:hypothetical protein
MEWLLCRLFSCVRHCQVPLLWFLFAIDTEWCFGSQNMTPVAKGVRGVLPELRNSVNECFYQQRYSRAGSPLPGCTGLEPYVIVYVYKLMWFIDLVWESWHSSLLLFVAFQPLVSFQNACYCKVYTIRRYVDRMPFIHCFNYPFVCIAAFSFQNVWHK